MELGVTGDSGTEDCLLELPAAGEARGDGIEMTDGGGIAESPEEPCCCLSLPSPPSVSACSVLRSGSTNSDSCLLFNPASLIEMASDDVDGGWMVRRGKELIC